VEEGLLHFDDRRYRLIAWCVMPEGNVAADPELASLEPKRAALAAEEKGLRDALDRQAAGKVQMHEATRAIEGHIAAGRVLAVQLHDGIRSHYGREAEVLNLFRMKPRRPKPLSVAAKQARKAKKAKKTPPESGPNPTPAASSETDGTTQEVKEV
jgi:hypothetical protein